MQKEVSPTQAKSLARPSFAYKAGPKIALYDWSPILRRLFSCSRQGLLAFRDTDGRAQLTHMGSAIYASCMPSEQASLLFRMLHGARKGR